MTMTKGCIVCELAVSWRRPGREFTIEDAWAQGSLMATAGVRLLGVDELERATKVGMCPEHLARWEVIDAARAASPFRDASPSGACDVCGDALPVEGFIALNCKWHGKIAAGGPQAKQWTTCGPRCLLAAALIVGESASEVLDAAERKRAAGVS